MKNARLVYVVLSGNSGAGKSTLLRNVARRLQRAGGVEVEAIDERQLHHPFLLNMFRTPEIWALPVQLNFILERFIRLKAAAQSVRRHKVVLMERCLREDELFFDFYFARRCMSAESRRFYKRMKAFFLANSATPDLMVYLRAESRTLIRRLEIAQRNGTRPREIMGKKLREYITEMNQRYNRWWRTVRGPARARWMVDIDRADHDTAALEKQIVTHALDQLNHDA